MNENPEIWTCPQCGMRQDISQQGFFAGVTCPECGSQAVVHQQLDNYRIDSVLGIGGMGVVFRAMDIVLGRPVAIKVLNDTYRDAPERIAGLETECALMAKVRHENVVSVYSAGRARGQFYIAMEYVEGRNLEMIMAERGFLLPADALEIVRQVALGLQAAHAAGLLHRDMKPGNIIMTTEGKAKVLDFGLSLEDKTGVEADEIIWATPYYVPPETLQRQPESIQADIYALGMTLRNLLTGEATLPGTPQSIDAILEAKQKLLPLEEMLPHVEPELSALVAHMTAFNEADRLRDYETLLEEVCRTQKCMVAAMNPEVREKRYRRKLYSAGGILGSILLGLLGGGLMALNTPSQTVQDVLETEALRWDAQSIYAASVQQLQAGHFVESAGLMADLAETSADAAVAAAAVLIRTAFGVLDGKMPDNGYLRFEHLVANAGDRVSWAGAQNFENLCQLVQLLKTDAAAAAEVAGRMDNSLLKVAAMILVADQYVQQGNYSQAEDGLLVTLDMLESCGAGVLRERVDEYRMSAPRRASRVALEQLRQLYQNGKLNEADTLAEELLNQKLTRLEKEEVRVLTEASAMMLIVRDALQSRGVECSDPYQMQQAVAQWQPSGMLAAEIACIARILTGQYDQAFSQNPYADSNDFTIPFAVMMRDWKQRLEK